MKFPVTTTAIAAIIVLGLAVYEFFTPGEHRIGPGTLLVIALLLVARYAAQYQQKKRASVIKSVPPRPLGLDDSETRVK